MFEACNVDGNVIDGLIFHAVGDAHSLFEFNIEKMSENFAKIGCTGKGDINRKIQELKRMLLGSPFSAFGDSEKKTRKKQMKKLAEQVFHICAECKKQIRELPFIQQANAEEEEVRDADDDSESEDEEPLYLP